MVRYRRPAPFGKPPSKPMEIFGEHWADHAARFAANWHQHPGDGTVIICSDTSWAMVLKTLTDPELDRRPARAQNHSARQP